MTDQPDQSNQPDESDQSVDERLLQDVTGGAGTDSIVPLPPLPPIPPFPG